MVYEKRLDKYDDNIYLTNQEALYHSFNNLQNVKVDWVGQQKSLIEITDEDSYFQSRLASEKFDTSLKNIPTSISFRAGSEHTIDNRRFDLEMQIELQGDDD